MIEINLPNPARRSKEAATRSSWKNFPITQGKKIPANLEFNKRQFQKIKLGHLPQEMEDKWFLFFEDGTIHVHRSWTGYAVFQAEIKPNNNGYVIEEIVVEDSFMNQSSHEDIQDLFSSLLKAKLLSE